MPDHMMVCRKPGCGSGKPAWDRRVCAPGAGPSVEMYLNDPDTTAPEALRTRLLIPIS